MKNNQYFFIVGAQRSGTTLLYDILDKHPQISMAKPKRPEPKIFLKESIILENEYLKKFHFDASKEIKIFGEKSTSYYEIPELPKRLKDFSKSTKAILLLRNPVERAISNYFFSKNYGLETRSLEEVFIQKIPPPRYPSTTSVSPFDYLLRGHYAKFIKNFLLHFSRDDFKVCFFENLIRSPSIITNIYSFLEIKTLDFKFNTSEKINHSNRPELVSETVMKSLKEYYRPYNKLIEKILEIPVPNEWNY